MHSPPEKPFPLLKVRWQNLLRSLNVSVVATQKAWLDIVAAYSLPGRYYHTLEHIEQVLQTIDLLKPAVSNLEIVQLAAWFHDSIYNSQAADNEERSCDYAHQLLTQLGISTEVVAAISRLILATKNHDADLQDQDSHVLLDADLAILGSSRQQYQTYAQAIRQEYHWVSEADYRKGRSQILEKFLQRQHIYFNPIMVQEYEPIARQNLRWELEILRTERY